MSSAIILSDFQSLRCLHPMPGPNEKQPRGNFLVVTLADGKAFLLPRKFYDRATTYRPMRVYQACQTTLANYGHDRDGFKAAGLDATWESAFRGNAETMLTLAETKAGVATVARIDRV